MQTELWRLGVAELAKAIREKQVSSREVVQAHLDRINAVNGRLNAVTVVLHEEALRAAEEADQALAKGAVSGSLHGVPMTVKENIDLATGMTPLGLGNDYGGSLRYPSQCCGTTAIRPTFGRVAWASSLAPAEYPITIQLFAVQG